MWVKILLFKNSPLYICSFYRLPNNDLSPLSQVNNVITTLYEKESRQTNLIIAGDFNMPDITWTEGYGQINSSPSYGTAVNHSLLDLASDNHLEQLIYVNTRQNHIYYWILCFPQILNIYPM